MFVRIFSSRRVPIYCVNLVLVSSNDPFVMLSPLSVFFVILVTVFTCYFRAIKMMNIKRIVYSSIERLQRKRQLHGPLPDRDSLASAASGLGSVVGMLAKSSLQPSSIPTYR